MKQFVEQIVLQNKYKMAFDLDLDNLGGSKVCNIPEPC